MKKSIVIPAIAILAGSLFTTVVCDTHTTAKTCDDTIEILNLDEVGELLNHSEKWEVNVGHNFDDLTPVTFNRDGYEVTFCERYDLANGEANIGFKICNDETVTAEDFFKPLEETLVPQEDIISPAETLAHKIVTAYCGNSSWICNRDSSWKVSEDNKCHVVFANDRTSVSINLTIKADGLLENVDNTNYKVVELV